MNGTLVWLTIVHAWEPCEEKGLTERGGRNGPPWELYCKTLRMMLELSMALPTGSLLVLVQYRGRKGEGASVSVFGPPMDPKIHIIHIQ